MSLLTFEEVDAPQCSLLSAEVKCVVAQTLITRFQCLSWTGAGRCYHSEERGTGGEEEGMWGGESMRKGKVVFINTDQSIQDVILKLTSSKTSEV